MYERTVNSQYRNRSIGSDKLHGSCFGEMDELALLDDERFGDGHAGSIVFVEASARFEGYKCHEATGECILYSQEGCSFMLSGRLTGRRDIACC